LDDFADELFRALRTDLDDVFEVEPSVSETVTPDLADAVISRTEKVIAMILPDGERLVVEQAKQLYLDGQKNAFEALKKQFDDPDFVFDALLSEPDEAALEEFAHASVESMRNTLYIGDKENYLKRVREITRQAADENWTTARLAQELRGQLDPQRQYFSDYMWERLARTDPSIYITMGRLKAYGAFGVPQVKRLVASDATDDLCAPYADQVYDLAEAEGVIPAHPNCRCAWAPYFG